PGIAASRRRRQAPLQASAGERAPRRHPPAAQARLRHSPGAVVSRRVDRLRARSPAERARPAARTLPAARDRALDRPAPARTGGHGPPALDRDLPRAVVPDLRRRPRARAPGGAAGRPDPRGGDGRPGAGARMKTPRIAMVVASLDIVG